MCYEISDEDYVHAKRLYFEEQTDHSSEFGIFNINNMHLCVDVRFIT